MSASMHRVFASPPALRTEILRHALLSQESAATPKLFSPTRRSIHVLHKTRGFHRPPALQYIIGRNTAGRRFESSIAAAPSASATLPTPSPAPTKSRTRRFITSTALVLVFFTTGLAMAAAPAAETVNGYVNPTSDAETLNLYHPPTPSAQEINSHIVNHPLAVKLRQDPEMFESRPFMRIPPAMRPHNLTAGTLLGEGMIEVPPLIFIDKKAELPTMTQIMHLGPNLCGHAGIIHGGLLATLLDEGLARVCFPALPNQIGVTASLKIDYRVPCPADRYVVLKAQTTKVDGRKAWSKGWIELLGEDGEGEGVKLVEAEALFIEPRNANSLLKNVATGS